MNNTAIDGPRLDFKRIGLEDEWCEANGNHQRTPEENLMFAILEDAIGLILHPSQNKEAEVMRARRWMRSDCDDYCFSFIVICEVFGFSPEGIRHYVLHEPKLTQGRKAL